MSDPTPHDTTYDPGAALAVTIVGFVLLMAVFAVPYFLDESWYRTPKPATTYTVVQGKRVDPDPLMGIPVTPARPATPAPLPYRPYAVAGPVAPASVSGDTVQCDARRPNLSGLK